MSEETNATQDNTNVAESTTATTEATTEATEQTTQTTEATTEQSTEQTAEPPADLLVDYKPTLPEGVELDQASMDVALPLLKEFKENPTPENADKLVAYHVEQMKNVGQRIVEDINSQCQTNYDVGMNEIKADKALGKDFEAKTGQINQMLTQYGGEHAPIMFQEALTAIAGFREDGPAVVKSLFSTVMKIAGDWADPKTILGSTITAEQTRYPGVPKGTRLR